MGVVLALYDGDGDVRLEVEDVVCGFTLLPRNKLAPNDEAALCETALLAELRYLIPACLLDGRGDELGADIALAEVFLVHGRGSKFVNGS